MHYDCDNYTNDVDNDYNIYISEIKKIHDSWIQDGKILKW